MFRQPDDFGNVDVFERVDALQHALFMAGYSSLPDGAVPEG